MINMAETRKLLPKSKTDVRGFSLPQTPEELRKLLKKAGLKSIHDLDQGYLGSGSQITQKQFLALRVVCPSLAPHSKLLESLDVYGLSKVWNDAVRMVTQSREYQAYLKLVPATQPLHFDHGASDYPGLFLPVLMFQKQTIRSSDSSKNPTNVPKRGSPEEHKPKRANYLESIRGAIQKLKSRCFGQVTEDSTSSDDDEPCAEDSLEVREEATTHAALMTLLLCISLLVRDSPVQWFLDREYFQARFKNGKCISWSDGVLRSNLDWKTLAIVKVKKRPRTVKGDEIVLQECAEMAGWFLKDMDSIPMLNG